jgi:hypothetical protein
MALTYSNSVRLLVYSYYEFRVQESLLFLWVNNNTRELKPLRRHAGVLGVPL